MKALKEKRLSLRSIFRRGLVILSLFALVFVSCGESGGTTEPPDNTGPGVTTPTNPPKTAISINVSKQPAAGTYSYQGQKPDLTGTEITVLWSDGLMEKIPATDYETRGFSASPGYCDAPGIPGGTSATLPNAGHFYIVHNATANVKSDEVKIPGVVWLDKITAGKGPKLYSDVPPFGRTEDGLQTGGLESVELKLSYLYYKDDDADKTLPFQNPSSYSVGSGKLQTHEETIKMTSAYPPINMSNAKNKKVTVGIGYIDFGNVNLTTDNKNTATGTAAPNGNSNPKKADITLDSYVQVLGIEYKADSANEKFYVLDDEVKYATGGVDPSDSKSYENPHFVKQLVSSGEPMFNVYYDNGDKREISWSAFLANVTYAYAKQGISLNPDNIFWGAEATQLDSLDPGDPYTRTILDYDDDTYTWTFQMEYVPKQYLDSDTAYIARFSVPVPVFEFQSQITVERKPGAVNNIWKPVSKAFDNTSATGGYPPLTYQSAEINDLYNAIKDRWVLKGVYQRYGASKTPEIPILSGYLYQGERSGGLGGTGAGTISLDRNLDLWKQLTGYAGGSAVIANREYPLPLRFRGETAVDEETILIDVYYQEYPAGPAK
jgi:hypothetical protein